MPTDHHLDPEEDALAKMGYELEDVDYKKLGKSIVWFFGFVIFCGVAGVIIFFLFLSGGSISEAWQVATKPPSDTSPLARRLPSEGNPLLQTNITTRTDIRDLRREESALLHGSPTWVNESKGVVRIPVEKAIEAYAQKMGASPTEKTTMKSGAPPVVITGHEESAAGGGH